MESNNRVKLLEKRLIAVGCCPYLVFFLQNQLSPDAKAFLFCLRILQAQEDHI